MNTPNYADMLPNHECNPQDAIEAISEKLPRYIREGLFEVDDFVQLFIERVHHIVQNLPENVNEKRIVEVELAYMIHDLYINQEIIIACDQEQANLRTIELKLEKEGVLTKYLKFSQEEEDSIDISKPELFVDFLDYLASYMSIGIEDVMVYLSTCINISQLDGGVDILMTHLGRRFSNISITITDDLIDQNRGYVGGKNRSIDGEIRHIMESEDLSYSEASLAFSEFQRDCAGLHFFLVGLYNEYIGPKLAKDALEEKYRICTMLDDLRDIADPHYYVPLVFQNGNIPALLGTISMFENGRNIH